jgi:hypothetical protein
VRPHAHSIRGGIAVGCHGVRLSDRLQLRRLSGTQPLGGMSKRGLDDRGANSISTWYPLGSMPVALALSILLAEKPVALALGILLAAMPKH